MRLVLLALAGLLAVGDARAADYSPTLPSSLFQPGTPFYKNWRGFYFGGQFGYGTSHVDFSHATQPLIANSLRESALENEVHPSQWPVLGVKDTASTSMGGFIGYNMQWDDAVFGIDLNYAKSNFKADAPVSPITRSVSAGGNAYVVNVTGTGSMYITDYGSLRGRGGYAIGNFLPYLTLGLALGRADMNRSATVSGTENGVPFSFTQSETRNAAFIYGWSVGAGLDVAITPNFFVRGEVEMAQFAPVSGIEARVTTARVGAGLKF